MGVAGSGCGFTHLLYIVHCIECMYKRAGGLFAVELVCEYSYHSGAECNLFLSLAPTVAKLRAINFGSLG